MRTIRYVALVVLLLGGTGTAWAGTLNVATTPLALGRLATNAVNAAKPPIGATLFREVSYTTASGQTIQMRLFANTPEQRKQMETFAERLTRLRTERNEDEPHEYSGGGLNSDGFGADIYGGADAWASWAVELACALVGGGAQLSGYVNLWLDAGMALCASFTIVDMAEALGDHIYQAYLASTVQYHPSVAPIVWGLYTYGGLPIY